MKNTYMFLLVIILVGSCKNKENEVQYFPNNSIFQFNKDAKTRWSSFENITAGKGEGGKINKAAKGYPYHLLQPGETVVLLKTDGAGIINRIWMTVGRLFNDPNEARAIRLDMYWDGESKPAVSVPLEDYFCNTFGRMSSFENELFASPEGRSFISYVQMPFRKGAKISLTNESKVKAHRVFYDVDFTRYKSLPANTLYFHSSWRRENKTKLGKDFEILPKIKGSGRFIGTNIGVIEGEGNLGWWGEGEVKVYLDGDEKYPTLVGTGTEDYIGSGWKQGVYSTRYSGCLLYDKEERMYSFYRLHIPDPIYFSTDCRVTIQQMGGTLKKSIEEMKNKNVPIKPVCFINKKKEQLNFFDGEYDFDDNKYPENIWTNYYREDDVCATSYFYLDKPTNNLPALVSFEKRQVKRKDKIVK